MPRDNQSHPIEPAHVQMPWICPAESGATRAAQLSGEIRDLITQDRVEDCFRVLGEARRATLWVRGAPANGQRFGYVEVPDHASRLASARIELAYRFGNPVSASEIRLLRAPGDEPTQLTPAQKLAELRQTGLDLDGIVKSWLASVENVTPPALGVPKSDPNEPTAPIADAYLDV